MLTTILLIGAGLFLRSLGAVQSLDLGLDVDRTLVVDMDLEHAGIAEATLPALRGRLLAAAAGVPGVAHAALSQGGPFGYGFGTGVRSPGLDSAVRASRQSGPFYYAVTSGYFEALGTRVLAGRGFRAGDGAKSAPVVVINATMARRLWPHASVLGRCLIVESEEQERCREIVGVVEDSRRRSVIEDPQMIFYLPLGQLDEAEAHQTLYVRAAEGLRPSSLTPVLREAIASAGGDLPYADIRPLADIVAPQLSSWRLGATMFTAFGMLALAVAALGLYSVLAYLVAHRTREIGVRIALGARQGEVFALVLRQGVPPVLAGAAAGAALALMAARYAAGLLYGVGPGDPAAYLSAGAALLVVAVLACLVPGWRAGRVDPMSALRAD